MGQCQMCRPSVSILGSKGAKHWSLGGAMAALGLHSGCKPGRGQVVARSWRGHGPWTMYRGMTQAKLTSNTTIMFQSLQQTPVQCIRQLARSALVGPAICICKSVSIESPSPSSVQYAIIIPRTCVVAVLSVFSCLVWCLRSEVLRSQSVRLSLAHLMNDI